MSNLDRIATAETKFHEYCTETYGYELHEYALIDLKRPVASLREEARAYLGKDVKIGNSEANLVLASLEGTEIYEHGRLRFHNPNDLISLVAMFVTV